MFLGAFTYVKIRVV